MGGAGVGRIQVLFVEDDPDWHDGLRDFFQRHPAIELAACVVSVEGALGVLQARSIDVVLLDVRLGERARSGIDGAADIDAAFPHVRIIMFSSLDSDDEMFHEAFLNGAYDYVYKYEIDQLPGVILSAMQNGRSKYGDRLRKLLLEQKGGLLQPADRELLALIAAGHSQQAVAALQGVSEDAVRKRIGRIRQRFRWQRSTRALAEQCERWGLLEG